MACGAAVGFTRATKRDGIFAEGALFCNEQADAVAVRPLTASEAAAHRPRGVRVASTRPRPLSSAARGAASGAASGAAGATCDLFGLPFWAEFDEHVLCSFL